MSQIIDGLHRASGAAIPKVIDYETARTLEKCIALTPGAQVSKIRTNAESREFGMHKTRYVPKRTFKGKLSKKGFKRYYYKNRYPDVLWNEISEQRKRSLLKKLSHRGVSKQSWYKLAQAAGLEVNAPDYVKKVPLNITSNFRVSRISGSESYSINLRNAQPTVIRIGGLRILKRAFAGRQSYFRKNMELGVFNEIDRVAKAYPGLIKVAQPTGGGMQ